LKNEKAGDGVFGSSYWYTKRERYEGCFYDWMMGGLYHVGLPCVIHMGGDKDDLFYVWSAGIQKNYSHITRVDGKMKINNILIVHLSVL
jgi:hypothetical protein